MPAGQHDRGGVVVLHERDVLQVQPLEQLGDHLGEARRRDSGREGRSRRAPLPARRSERPRRPRVAFRRMSEHNADEMLAVAASRAGELAAPGLSPRPRRRVAVLACMDTRIDLFPMLGLQRGDAHIIRNAGGLATDDAIRSLSVSQRLLGTRGSSS